MNRLVLFISFLVAVIASTAADPIEPASTLENSIEARALYTGSSPAQNGLVLRVKCVTDTIEAIVSEHRKQSLWQDVQTKIHINVNNLLSCLKYNGYPIYGCIAREVIVFGLNVNGFLSKFESETPEGGKQIRLRLAASCSKQR